MTRFDAHIRDLGEVPRKAILSVTEKLSASHHLWASDETEFLTAFVSTEHIVFKFPDNYPLSHVPASYRGPWAEWEHLLAPIIEGAVRSLGFAEFETSKVMFTKLKPGGRIPTHSDENPSSVIPHKIHVPLVTHPKVILRVDGVPYHLQVGRAYELNNLLPHGVENDSDMERIHFIFDCFPVVGPARNG